MAAPDWQLFEHERCKARLAVVKGYLISEVDGHLVTELGTVMVRMCDPVFTLGGSLGAFHVWRSPTYDTGYRQIWMNYMRHWGIKFFRDMHIYVPPGLARMGLSVGAAMRIGEVVIHKSEASVLAERHRVLGF